MDDLFLLIQQHRAITLALMGAISLTTAGFSALWLRQELRDGVSWLGGNLMWLRLRPSRTDMPALYWFAIASHVVTTAVFALAGVALLVWGLMVAL